MRPSRCRRCQRRARPLRPTLHRTPSRHARDRSVKRRARRAKRAAISAAGAHTTKVTASAFVRFTARAAARCASDLRRRRRIKSSAAQRTRAKPSSTALRARAKAPRAAVPSRRVTHSTNAKPDVGRSCRRVLRRESRSLQQPCRLERKLRKSARAVTTRDRRTCLACLVERSTRRDRITMKGFSASFRHARSVLVNEAGDRA